MKPPRRSTGRRGEDKTEKPAEEPSGPFTLVLYTEFKSLGVVTTESLDVSNGIGGICDAPDPHDWDEKARSDLKFEATIVAFGRKYFTTNDIYFFIY